MPKKVPHFCKIVPYFAALGVGGLANSLLPLCKLPLAAPSSRHSLPCGDRVGTCLRVPWGDLGVAEVPWGTLSCGKGGGLRPARGSPFKPSACGGHGKTLLDLPSRARSMGHLESS